MLYPLIFRPILKERVWGGRKLAALYDKPLPPGTPIGESWEVSDRPGDASVIANGPLAGKDLRWLVEHHGGELMGDAQLYKDRFPLLIKILDARERLSLQVHPPADKAKEMGGEPKTEMWYIADADPGAELYVGLRRGITRAEFEEKIRSGVVSECFHRIPVKRGDAMFLPSGRVHAIGAGLVIFEIQQNSDTTYRVFDWNRMGLDGKPRQLHIQESLASIDFNDFEPGPIENDYTSQGPLRVRPLVADPLFSVSACELAPERQWRVGQGTMRILAVLSGTCGVGSGTFVQPLRPGDFCLLPASLSEASVQTDSGVQFLDITA